MSFFTVARQETGTQVFSFHGRITFGPQTGRCRENIKRLLSQGERRFVFDLSDVEYVDSAGIGFLVSCLSTLWKSDAGLRLASPPERVRHVLTITRLDTVFEICQTRAEALRDVDWGRRPFDPN